VAFQAVHIVADDHGDDGISLGEIQFYNELGTGPLPVSNNSGVALKCGGLLGSWHGMGSEGNGLTLYDAEGGTTLAYGVVKYIDKELDLAYATLDRPLPYTYEVVRFEEVRTIFDLVAEGEATPPTDEELKGLMDWPYTPEDRYYLVRPGQPASPVEIVELAGVWGSDVTPSGEFYGVRLSRADPPTEPGDSGSPLFTKDGQVWSVHHGSDEASIVVPHPMEVSLFVKRAREAK